MRARTWAGWITLLAVLGSCAEDSPSAVVRGNIPPDETCVFNSDNPRRVRGLLDLHPVCQPFGYTMGLLVESQLIDRGNPSGQRTPVRADPNTLRITEAEVEIQAQGGQPLAFEAFDPGLPNPFTVSTSAVIASAEEDEPGEGIVLVEAIPQVYVDAMREAVGPGQGGVIVVSIKLIGETSGGIDVDVARFEYPVQLCNACLIRCLEDIGGDQDTKDEVESACNAFPGSDGGFCITNASRTSVCPRGPSVP